jgi:hypothetical protein
MRRVYGLWAAGLLLKLLGASWDVSWHFRFLRETFSPPHVINLCGELLVAAAFLHEWRHLERHRRAPLLVVAAGGLTFLVAIPFDQWWHLTFGIDITTWSPSHLMLFYGTVLMVAGIALLYLADLKKERGSIAGATRAERAMLALLLILLAESLAFPLTYNEYTTTGVANACGPTPSIDPALVGSARLYAGWNGQRCLDPVAAMYHGTPVWLYPLYSVAIAVLVATLARASLGPGWALVALAGLTIERGIANAILSATGWPPAVVPLQYVGIGLALEAVWTIPVRPRVRAIAGGIAAALAAYATLESAVIASAKPGWPPAVPVDAGSWPWGVPLAALIAWGAYELQARAEPIANRVNDGPEWQRVSAWAKQKWDGLRS